MCQQYSIRCEYWQRGKRGENNDCFSNQTWAVDQMFGNNIEYKSKWTELVESWFVVPLVCKRLYFMFVSKVFRQFCIMPQPSVNKSSLTMLHTLTQQHCSNMYTTHDPTDGKYAHACIDKYRHRPHTEAARAHTHAHRCAPACTQSQLPVFPPSRSGAPHGPWCHWWGHVLGQRQHRDGPLRAAANYEVMDQHMLMHTPTYTHTWPV